MRTIYKYVIPPQDTVQLLLPVDAKPLCVMAQSGDIMLWAEVTPGGAGLTRTFLVRGTGNPFTGEEGAYIGSVQVGMFVWHIYEAKP